MDKKSIEIYENYIRGSKPKDLAHIYNLSLSRIYQILDTQAYLHQEGPKEILDTAVKYLDGDSAVKFVFTLKRHNIKSVGDLWSFMDQCGGYRAIWQIGRKGKAVILELLSEMYK